MLHNKLSAKRRAAVMGAICESLEVRRLLATYVVPDGHSIAYLVEGFEPGQVDVHLDLPSNPVAFTFTATTGQHVIDAGNNEDFLFVDQVRSEWKPQGGAGNPQGIKFTSEDPDGGNATVRIEADIDDRSFVIDDSASGNTIVRIQNITLTNFNVAHLGEGITNLVIRTNDFTGAENYWPTFPNPGTTVSINKLTAGLYLTVDTGIATYPRVQLEPPDGKIIAEEATVITGGGYSHVTTRGNLAGITEAFVDFGTRSTVGNNLLTVNRFSIVTLGVAPNVSSHHVVVEDVIVKGDAGDKPGILRVKDPSTIDDLWVRHYGFAYVWPSANGTNIPVFRVERDPVNTVAVGQAWIQGKSTIGTLTNDGYVEFTPSSRPSTVTTFEVTAATVAASLGEVVLGGAVEEGANVTALTSSRIGSLTIGDNAKLTLQPRASGGPARLLTLGSLSILKSADMPFGELDLKDNSMIVDHSGDSPLDDIRRYITHAYSGGTWGGKGITSSLADSSTRALGYAENDGSSSGVNYSSFEGQTVDNTTVLVKWTYYGDANLDAKVNIVDFNRLASNFNVQSGAVWSRGDFTYDGKVNIVDFNRLASNFNAGTGSAEHDDYTYEELEEMLPD